jgi:AraC-like DNA-binding protein
MIESSKMEIDALSAFLKLVDAKPVVSGGFTAGGAWALRFSKPEYLKFFAMVKGSSWLRVGEEAPVRVEEGDVLLLSVQAPFVLASEPEAAPVEAKHLFAGKLNKIIALNAGNDCLQIGGHVQLDPTSGKLLYQVLPPLIHVRATSRRATTLKWLLDQLVRERAEECPGAGLVSVQLAQMLFVQVLRAYLETDQQSPIGWLRAVSDRKLSPALALMHSDPGRVWQLDELARAAAMSRTGFAVRFKSAAGVSPLAYLTQWRMLLAQRALRIEGTPISVLTSRLGYGSESAFSHAFKRVTGLSPARYRDRSTAFLE